MYGESADGELAHMGNRLWQIGIWQKGIWRNDVVYIGGSSLLGILLKSKGRVAKTPVHSFGCLSNIW